MARVTLKFVLVAFRFSMTSALTKPPIFDDSVACNFWRSWIQVHRFAISNLLMAGDLILWRIDID